MEDLVTPKEKGWFLVCVDGYPLGFGKLASQTLKTNICRAGDGSRKEQRTKWQGVNRNENKTG